MARRLKVLVSAYACSPRRGSEAGVGWGWVEAISKYHDLWVITGDEEVFPNEAYKYRQEIEEELFRRPELRSRLRFYHINKKRNLQLEKLWPLSYLWFYRVWEWRAYKLAERLHADVGFDLMHQLTYVGYRVPGYLWRIQVPFVWGPIGGLENTTWRLLPMLGPNGALYYAGRNIINSLHKRFLIRPRKAFRRARGGIIAATQGIRKEILRNYGEDSHVINEVGPPEYSVKEPSMRKAHEPLKVVWSGDHTPGKALPLLLKALARLNDGINWELAILGQGTCTRKWQRLAARLGIDDRCSWKGWLSRGEALRFVQKSHVLAITSVKDLTSTVLLEGLTQGLPVICLDHCGFSNVVTPECGIKVPVGTPRQIQSDMATAFRRLDADEEERRRLAYGALRRINDFSWDKKSALMNSIYQRAIGNKTMN